MNPAETARSIFHHALSSCSIPAAFDRKMHLPSMGLEQYEHIYAVAVGKAALPMLETLRSRLPYPLAGGICCAPVVPVKRIDGIEYYTGGHPLPNEDSFASARATLKLLERATARDLVFFLISGGGSAMFELPLDESISLEETRGLYKALVGSGGTIAEINAVRKHFSAVKGGRLAAAVSHAAQFSLLLADVAPRYLDALSSGLTIPDSSTVAECREVLDRYQLLPRLTPSVRAFFENPRLPETPSLSGPAPMEILLSSDDLVDQAREMAVRLGYEVVIDNSCDDWDYLDAAHHLLGRFVELEPKHSKLCLLSAGEVTVRLGHEHGAGGRNQQFALACALDLPRPMVVLSAGSDGIDGNSPAAGAVVDATTVQRSKALGLDPAAAIERFDAYPLFTALGDTLMTGPTHNNLRDLRILLSV
jgi:glycerate 2-kinase